MDASATYAKPFVKWVGGKTQLLSQLTALLPADFATRRGVTYVEPFVGGGAMLFHMLRTFPGIARVVIGDSNADLTLCYRTVRDSPQRLIAVLADMQARYRALADDEARRQYYMDCRSRFNARVAEATEQAALLMFLNRTCFNGLYRVNRRGGFNVPFGRYAHPTICDAPTILADSRALQGVEILTGDFRQTLAYAAPDSFFYLDPPYRPLPGTANFNDYTKEAFNDASQQRLKVFCDELAAAGAQWLQSNSDGSACDSGDRFFDDLYAGYTLHRVLAARCVNANAAKRGKISELAVTSYNTHDTSYEAAI